MSTWKQEIAAELTPIEGVNDANATFKWNITVIPDPYSPVPQPSTVVIQRTITVKGDAIVDARLIDGKNYVAGDHYTEFSYLKYKDARVPLSTDPQIISGGVVKSLEDMRPITQSDGIDLGVDTITISNKEWYICRVEEIGIMNDEDTGNAVPAKLRFTLRSK